MHDHVPLIAGRAAGDAIYPEPPPIGTVQDLITIQQAMGLKSEAFSIEEKKDWATVKANVLKKVSPIKDLIREMKSRTDAVNKRTTSHAKDAKPSSKPTVLNANCCVFNL